MVCISQYGCVVGEFDAYRCCAIEMQIHDCALRPVVDLNFADEATCFSVLRNECKRRPKVTPWLEWRRRRMQDWMLWR